MTGLLIVAEAVLLGVLILLAEALRPRVRGRVDFLRASSAVYFICFVVLPIYLQLDDMRGLRGGVWAWVLKRPFDDEGFVYAGAIAFIGYACLLVGIHLAGGLPHRNEGVGEARAGANVVMRGSREVLLVSLGIGFAGLVCLVVYTLNIGGLGALILQAAAFRGTNPPVVTPYAFLKTLSPLVMGGALLIYGLRTRYWLAGRRKRYGLVFVTFLVGSFAILFHQAGRFPLAVFVFTFPLAAIIRRDRLRLRVVLASALLVVGLLLFGKQLFEATQSRESLTSRWESVGEDARVGIRMLMVEFAFPTITAANAMLEVPSEVPFRWFYDFPLAVEYLVPQRLFGISHPATVSMVNSTRFATVGTIPVDLVSLGYYSAGVPGVVLLLLAFGVLLAMLERALPPSADPVDCVLRAVWILLVALRVMYGDPQLIWFGGLHLFAIAALLPVAHALVRRRGPNPHPHASVPVHL
jgi:hypothetical protein